MDTQAWEGQRGVLRQHTPEHSSLLVHYTEVAWHCSSSHRCCRPRIVGIPTSRLIYRCFQPSPGESHRDTIWQSLEMAELFSDQRETFQLLVCKFLKKLCAFSSPDCTINHVEKVLWMLPALHHRLLADPVLSLVPVVAQELPMWIHLWIRN